MKIRNLALIVFYNENKEILIPDRSNMSKFGEDYGYFGGKIEENETSEQAAIREIKEELEFNLKKITFLGQYESEGKRLNNVLEKVTQNVFITKITNEEFKSMIIHEGAGMEWFTLEKTRKLNMIPLDPKIIDDAEAYIKKYK